MLNLNNTIKMRDQKRNLTMKAKKGIILKVKIKIFVCDYLCINIIFNMIFNSKIIIFIVIII